MTYTTREDWIAASIPQTRPIVVIHDDLDWEEDIDWDALAHVEREEEKEEEHENWACDSVI